MWYINKICICKLLITITILFNLSSVQSLNEYPGMECRTDPDCDPTVTFMECVVNVNTKTCQCVDPVISYFDRIVGRCYRKVGVHCDPSSPDPDQCSPNTICEIPTEICECKAPFKVTDSMKCVIGDDKKCLQNQNCDRDAFKICDLVNGCSCNGTSIFDETIQKCVLQNKATCEIRTDYYPQPCVHGSECDSILKVCQCSDPFQENVNGQCKIEFDGPCMLDEECDDVKYLECNPARAKCQCPQGSTYVDQTCKILANQQCPGEKNQTCIDFADCKIPGNGDVNYKCICRPELIQSPSYNCVHPYGANCLSVPNEPLCNEDIFQVCNPNTKRCDCNDVQNSWYDPFTRTCFLLEDAQCNPDVDVVSQPCAPNSHCVPSPSGGGHCKCTGSTVVNNDRRCYLPLDQLCDPSNDLCDKTKFLECNPLTRRCGCDNPDESILDEINKECRRRANFACAIGSRDQKCVEFSTCQQAIGSNQYRCHCENDLEGNIAGKCIRPYDSRCGSSFDSTCNVEGYQDCKNGFCVCIEPSMMIYNPNDMTCYLTINSPCTVNNQPCKEQLICDEGHCHCDWSQGFQDDGHGGCGKMFGSICEKPEDCSSKDFLKCINGTCNCIEDFVPVENANGTISCLGTYGAHCSGNSECNAAASLICQSTSCACSLADEQQYDTDEMKCLSNLNARCHLNGTTKVEILLECNHEYICLPAENVTPPLGRCGCESVNSTGCQRNSADIKRVEGFYIQFIILVSIFLGFMIKI